MFFSPNGGVTGSRLLTSDSGLSDPDKQWLQEKLDQRGTSMKEAVEFDKGTGVGGSV